MLAPPLVQPTQLALDLLLQTQPTLDNFVVGSNAQLVALLRLATTGQVNSTNLFIWGDSGAGKTHLLQGVVKYANEHAKEETKSLGNLAVYLCCESPSAESVQQIESILKLQSSDVLPSILAIDNLEAIASEQLDNVFALQNRYRQAKRGILIISSRFAPQSLKEHLGQRSDIVSRLAWGLTYRVHALADDDKALALKNFLDGRGSQFSPEVIPYLLTHQSRSIHDLAALVDQIDRYAFTEKRPITLPLVRQFLMQ